MENIRSLGLLLIVPISGSEQNVKNPLNMENIRSLGLLLLSYRLLCRE